MTNDFESIAVSLAKLNGKTDLIANDVKHIREGVEERTKRLEVVEDRADKADRKIYMFSGAVATLVMFSDKLKNLVLGQ